jgi:hypothetical protein
MITPVGLTDICLSSEPQPVLWVLVPTTLAHIR